jgi:uncharacterized ferritin-like protein (DUF455 family)
VTTTVQEAAGVALSEPDLRAKAELVSSVVADWSQGRLRNGVAATLVDVDRPGRPNPPQLVGQRELPKRSYGTPHGRAAVLHSVAHIEANAINLALDAVHRFGEMPPEFVSDWLGVAADEVRHFQMLTARLAEYGMEYGDLPAHDGLWAMARDTSTDLVARMALVPRYLEARGLDAGPPMIAAFNRCGDPQSASLIEVITAEEVPHVSAGDRWFRWACQAREIEPESAFLDLLSSRGLWLAPPVNSAARHTSGFGAEELANLASVLGEGTRSRSNRIAR